MGYQEFIIKDGADGKPPRIGQIVESSPNSPEFVVLWNDSGDRESVRTSGSIVRAREGSFTYLLKTKPELIAHKFAEEPLELLRSLLVDNNFAAKSNKEITEALVNRAKLDGTAVAAMWKQNKPLLVALEDVSTQGSGGSVKYKIAKPPLEQPAKKRDRTHSVGGIRKANIRNSELVAPASDAPSKQKLITEGNSIDLSAKEEPRDSLSQTDALQAFDKSILAEQKVSTEESANHEIKTQVATLPENSLPVSAVYVLGGLLDIHERSDSTNVLSSGVVVDYVLASIEKTEGAKPLAQRINNAPMSSGVLLEELSNKLISGFAKKLTKQQLAPIHSAALSRSRQTANFFPGFQDWLGSLQAVKALTCCISEFEGHSASPTVAQREALFTAFSRILDVKPECILPMLTVTNGLINALQLSGDREAVTKNLTERFVKAIKDSPKFPIDAEALLELGQVLSEHRFTTNGPRSLILAALGHLKPELVVGSIWWRGLDFEDLDFLNTSPLGALLSKEPFASDVVSPLVRSEIHSISTRKGIAKLIAAPSFALEYVTPSDIEAVMHRAAKSDKNAQTWIDVLSRTSQAESLEANLSVSKEEKLVLVEQNNSLTKQVDGLICKISSLQSQLDNGRSQAGALSTRERRQISIDAYRDLARIVATIESEAEKLSTEQLLAKVNALLDRSSVSRSANIGDQVEFDPRLHMSPGGRPDNGTLVSVLRSGYQWFDGQEEVVLVEALVSSSLDK